MTASPNHATASRYTRGCRCDPCKQAMSRYRRQYRLSATGTIAHVDRDALSDLLHELFPDGLTQDCPAAAAAAAAARRQHQPQAA